MEAVPYLLRGVILPLLLGGILAYLYPNLQAYFKNPSSFRQARLDQIRDEYRMIRQCARDRSFLITCLVFRLASLLGQLAVLILASTLHIESLFGNFVGLILYGSIATSCLIQVNAIHNMINNSTAFNTYRQKTIAVLKRLGSNPDDLDKEDELRG